MFKSYCFKLQAAGVNVPRASSVLRPKSSKKCRSSSVRVIKAFGNKQDAYHRIWNPDNPQCFSNLGDGIDLQRGNLIPKKGLKPVNRSLVPFKLRQTLFSSSALDKQQLGAESAQETSKQPSLPTEEPGQNNGAWKGEVYPSGEFEYEEIGGWNRVLVELKMLIAWPWERVRQGSVLKMKLRGQISDKLPERFSSKLSLPKICENFIKAAHDPRIAGICLHIEPLSCGWGKIEEIRRHILDYRKSGKFVVCYLPVCSEMEYYLACACGEIYVPPGAYIALYGLKVQATFLGGVFEKIGVQPQVQRIGKYKSTGDLLSRKNMSKENCEMLTAILDDIYENWVEKVSFAQGKTKGDIENLLNEGIYKVERLKEEGLINDIKYDDEVTKMLKERLGQDPDEHLRLVEYEKYSRVSKWTLGLAGGRDQIAIIRSSGSISRVRGRFSTSSGIVSEQFIQKIREVRESERYKAVILRIDSPGGDALASDLMWREIKLLAASKPVIASMSDVAASGGYYMAMAAGVILSENLTLTGSIGVVTGKFSLSKLYERIGFNKEIISRGRFAELDAENRPFRPDEEELFARSAQNAYKQFRDKAAFSREMSVEKMEDVAQGRVWTGKAAANIGLVDAIGGFSRAVAIAKQKAGIPLDEKVSLVELSKGSRSLLDILGLITGGARALISFKSSLGLDESVQEFFEDLSPPGVQARMDGIIFQGLGEHQDGQAFIKLIKDYLSSF
uniref:Putative SPPA1 n=1 Tax=Cupressus duclouxiana TaxID=103966 RepID=A0A3Q8BRN1_9CONI|nr:putative SPPA1 [Cupressus duclouxiana]